MDRMLELRAYEAPSADWASREKPPVRGNSTIRRAIPEGEG